MAGAVPGWARPQVVTELRKAFGDSLMLENDVDAAALAERAHGHGREVDSFAYISVIAVVDPELIVLGGGIGQADGFRDAVWHELRRLTPVHPELRVSALGVDAVVDGCVAAGIERAWELLTANIFANVPRPEIPARIPALLTDVWVNFFLGGRVGGRRG